MSYIGRFDFVNVEDSAPAAIPAGGFIDSNMDIITGGGTTAFVLNAGAPNSVEVTVSGVFDISWSAGFGTAAAPRTVEILTGVGSAAPTVPITDAKVGGYGITTPNPFQSGTFVGFTIASGDTFTLRLVNASPLACSVVYSKLQITRHRI
jgi:hypothetical protein